MGKKAVFKIKRRELETSDRRMTVNEAWQLIEEQSKAEGRRPVTIRDYRYYFWKYVEFNDFHFVDQFNRDSIYKWLNGMDVQTSTKRIRLKCLKACLGRLYSAGKLEEQFYKTMVIKVDEETKEGLAEEELEKLLACLDFSDWFQLRDACAILLIWQTGIRNATLCQLKMTDIDFKEQLLICPGSIMKNHRKLVLPLPDNLTDLLEILVEHNREIIKEMHFDTDLIFFSRTGRGWLKENGNSEFCKRLLLYKKEFGIKNLTAHSIRRGFAKRLLNEGVSVPVISKALGHSDLSTTTKYLNISEAELINELRRLQ